MQSPGTSCFKNKSFGFVIKKLARIVESILGLHEQQKGLSLQFKISHQLIHELVAILTAILNNGIDHRAYVGSDSHPTPSQSNIDSSKNFYTLLNLMMPNRKSIKFINSLSFLKNDKMRASVWLLCEVSGIQTIIEDGKIIEIFQLFGQSAEIQSRFGQNSIMKLYHCEILEFLEMIYSDHHLELQGEIIYRFQKFSLEDSDLRPETLVNFPSVKEEDDFATPRLTRNHDQQSPPSSPFHEPRPMIFESVQQKQELQKSALQLINLKTKSSVILYNTHFEKYVEDPQYTRYSQKPQRTKLSMQQNSCYNCQVNIAQGLLPFIQGTAYFCHYSGKWFCKSCMSEKHIAIPYRAAKEFDLSAYPVSRGSYNQIKQYYHKPIIMIHYFDDVVFRNKQLHDFMIMKRQLHLLYDSYCRTDVFDLAMELQEHRNLFLTINLFSMHDLDDIISGFLPQLVKQIYEKGVKHMQQCDVCLMRGFQCPACQSNEKIFAHDIIKTQYCRSCKSLYHRRCFVACINCSKKQQ